MPQPVTARPVWAPVRQALTESPRTDSALEPVTDKGLGAALTAAVKLYHDNQYSDLALVLPGLLRDAHDRSPLLRSRVLQLTGSVMIQTRQRDTARIALDRALVDADEAGSILDAASCIITTCWLLLMEQQFEEVRTLALHWADRIEPRLCTATTAELSTWGWLLLRASAAAIRDNRPDEAAHVMRLAEAAAITVGHDHGTYHSYWTTFGRATVAMKHVENAVIDDKPDIALALAGNVPASLRPTSDNRNRHLPWPKSHCRASPSRPTVLYVTDSDLSSTAHYPAGTAADHGTPTAAGQQATDSAALEELAAELSARGYRTRLNPAGTQPLSLTVTNPGAAPPRCRRGAAAATFSAPHTARVLSCGFPIRA